MAYDYAYDDIDSLIDSFYPQEEDGDDDLSSLIDSFYGDDEPEPEEEDSWDYTPAPVEEVAPVSPEPESEDTEYNWTGAFKQAGYQTARAMGGSLPSMIGKLIPGDDPIERIGTENKAQYDAWMKESADVQKHQQSVAKETEGFLPEVVGSIGPTLAGLTTSIIPIVGPYLAAAEFLDLNKEEIYDQAKAKGADEDTAEIVSWTGGAINSALDMTGLGALKRVFKPGKKITKFLVDYALATQIEGGTESVQDVVGKVATEYAIRPKDESETDFMARMWDKKGELVADAWHAYTIGAGTTALLGVPAGVHQGVTGGLTGDVEPTTPPIDPDRKKIIDETKLETEIDKVTGVPDTSGVRDEDKDAANKAAEASNRLDADTNANALKAAEARLEEERLAAVPANLKLYKADLEAGTATIDDIEGYGVTQEDIDADNTRREAIAAKDSAQKEKAGADKARAKAEVTFKEHRAETDEHLKGETLNGMMLDVVEDDGDTKKNVQADAGEVLRESNKLEDIMTEIKGCLGGK